MARLDAPTSGARMLGDKSEYVAVKPLTTAPSAPIKHATVKVVKESVVIDGISLTASEYAKYRAIKAIAVAQGKPEPTIYICVNKQYELSDARQSRRIEFIVY